MIQLTQRQINHGVFGLVTAMTVTTLGLLLIRGPFTSSIIPTILTSLTCAVLWFAYWYGWDYARQAFIALLTLLVAVGIPEENVLQNFAHSIYAVPAIALVLVGPGGILGSAVVVLAVLGYRADGGPYTSPFDLITFVLIIGGMIFSRLAVDNVQRLEVAKREAEESRARAEAAQAYAETERARAEQQAQELAVRAAEQSRLLQEIQQQRDIIREMSVPVLPISRDTLVMPLIGALDSARLAQVQMQALAALEQTHARYLLLDITGVPVVDTQVAQGVIRVVQAVKLLGAETMLVGIRPEVAQAIVGLGLDLSGITTCGTLESGIAAALGNERLNGIAAKAGTMHYSAYDG